MQSCITFSRCMAGRIQTGQVLVHADGGEDPSGVWGQSAQQRNVAWWYVNRSFVGGSVGFEGPFDDGSGAMTSGAWRGCLD